MADNAASTGSRHGGRIAKLPEQAGELEWLILERPSRLRCYLLDADRRPLPAHRVLWVHDGPDHPEVRRLQPCTDDSPTTGCWEVELPEGRNAGDADLLRIETESAGYRVRLGQVSSF